MAQARYIRQLEQQLEFLKKQKPDQQDRLGLVTQMLHQLRPLYLSANGWMLWLSNTTFMMTFTVEELQELNKCLTKLIIPFLEYDLESTKKYDEKIRSTLPKTKPRSSRNMPTWIT